MTRENILVPYNFTNYDKKALEFVIRNFASHSDVDITIFVTYTPIPKVDIAGSPVMDRLSSSLNYLEQRKTDQEAALNKAVNILIESGFQQDRVHALFSPKKKDVSAEIIELVQRNNYTLVVLNHKPGKVTNFFTGNVYSKVINSLKDTAICVVT